MKILHADTDDLANPLRGGAPVRTFEVNSRLAGHHEITVLTATYSGARRYETIAGIQYERLGFQIPYIGLSPHLTYLTRLRSCAKSKEHDLIVEEFMPPVGFCGLPWKTDKPVISLIQWFFFDFWENRYHLPFHRWMTRIITTGRYRNFIVQTDCMGNTIRRLQPKARICKIPCGIDSQAFIEEKETRYDDFVLFLGRLDVWQKGLDILIEAWKRCCAAEHIKLVIAGSGPARNTLEQQIFQDDLHHLISFCGPVHGADKRDLLRRCRFMVMPSRQETFGLTALEAMAAGKAVVAFDIDHLNELLDPQWAQLVKEHNPDHMGRAVCQLWKNKHKSYELGSRGRQHAHSYSWDNIAALQERFYLDVLEDHSHENCIVPPMDLPARRH